MAEYIVSGARMICDKGEFSSVLSIQSGRMRVGGKLAAGRKDCVPQKHVAPFGMCSSGTYLCSGKAKPGEEHPCVLDLMDHYYLTDEEASITDLAEQVGSLESCRRQIRDLISLSVNEMTGIQHERSRQMNYALSDRLSEQYSVIWRKTENLYEMRQAAGEIAQAAAAFAETARQNCAYLKEGCADASLCQRLDAVCDKQNLLISQGAVLSGLPEAGGNQMVTTESFLICRCGGVITFESSGQ